MLFQSICLQCGTRGYVFQDQIEKIKQNDNLALHKYVKGRVSHGDQWFCIKCDSANKNPLHCTLEQLPSDKAEKIIAIRKRETNVKSHGIVLPSLY